MDKSSKTEFIRQKKCLKKLPLAIESNFFWGGREVAVVLTSLQKYSIIGSRLPTDYNMLDCFN